MFDKKYKMDYGTNKSLFIDARSRYKADEIVRLKVPKSPEALFTLYINGDELKPLSEDDDEYFEYEFVMPQKNVAVTFDLKSLYRIQKEAEKLEVKPTTIIDYFEKPIAVEGGRGYYEMVLSTYGTERAVLDIFDMPDAEGEEEYFSYEVPFEAVDEVLGIIDACGMAEWENRNDTTCITGRLFVCRFKFEGNYINVSSKKMPVDGTASFYRVKNYLSRYLTH